MMIRQEFSKFPPTEFMMQILDNLAKTYVFLWQIKDREDRIDLTWKDITKYHNKNSFRSCLRKLNREGLLSYQESSDGVFVEMIGWEDIE